MDTFMQKLSSQLEDVGEDDEYELDSIEKQEKGTCIASSDTHAFYYTHATLQYVWMEC